MRTFSDCPCSGATLDKLVQPAILATLMEGPLHGYRLAERIGEMTGCCGENPDVSGIYRSLKKMEAMGLVTSQWETAATGHAKRLFEITPDGKSCLGQWTATLESYLATVKSLTKAVKTATAAAPKRRKTCCK